MRLFAAIPIPSPAREAIARLLDELRAEGWPVRWVRSEGLHLTLKFFGEVSPDRLDAIAEALRFAAAGVPPLSLAVTSLGAFPTPQRPRVIWVGLDAPGELELLQDRIERGAEALGFPTEGAPFRPHVTLGRVKEGFRLPPEARRRFDGAPLGVECLAGEVVLYESRLAPTGPVYTSRTTIPLSRD